MCPSFFICLPSYLVGFGFPLLILCIGAVPMNTRYLLAITIFTVAFWTSGDLPAEYVAICCLVALVVTETLTFSQAWGGAASSAVWLCFAGNALSQAVGSTNLIKIVSWKLAEHASTPFMGYVQIGVAGTISAVLIPSGIVRVLLMIPVGRSLSDSLGLNPRSGLSCGLKLTGILTTVATGIGVLTGLTPNAIILSALEENGYDPISWTEWSRLLLVISLLRGALIIALCWMLRGGKDKLFSLLRLSSLLICHGFCVRLAWSYKQHVPTLS
jgi:di/tricarboxylate transporter